MLKKGINIIVLKDVIEVYRLGLVKKDLDNNKDSVDYLKTFANKLYKLTLNIRDESVGEDVKYDILTAEDYLESALYYDANVTLASFITRMEKLLKPLYIYAEEYENSVYKKIK